MAELELRPLQVPVVAAAQDAFRRAKNILIQAPCGFGKTELATYLLKITKRKGNRGAFIMDRIALVNQASERFKKYGLSHGVTQAQHDDFDPLEPIQVCSLQTISGSRGWPDVKLQIIDECHVLSKKLRERLAARERYTIGLTATPFTKGLGKYFDVVINAATTNQLIREGWLVPFRVFAASEPDMAGAKVVAGEWSEKEAESRAMPIIGDVVDGYKMHGQGEKFIAFASSVSHAEEMQRQFMVAGVVCNLYTYRQTDDERNAAVEEFRKPDSYIRGLISIESLTRGFDVPDVRVLILARPLRKALAVHIQMLGRVLRCSPETGKTEAIVLDHSGNCMRFWSEVQDFFENGIEELDDGKPKEAKPTAEKESKPAKCPTCFHVHDARPACPSCGHVYATSRELLHVAGTLAEVKPSGSAKPAITPEARARFHAELLGYAAEKGKSASWVKAKFKEKYDAWPPCALPAPVEASTDTRRWITSRNMAYAARTKKAARV
ncbi:helicase [Massilia violaceinigra]|uniref:Helicase n=1 Tax=Massilia violaceinigra TaxID=2045208 RepID=A0A2D2DIP2_9BURK|nr:DEAD/DEAH box helicase family protein [Massilia violaceinigra]ATQ74839.1 helicase [Massilia violaceinigra]